MSTMHVRNAIVTSFGKPMQCTAITLPGCRSVGQKKMRGIDTNGNGYITAHRWWSKDTVAVVTGGNRGIGFEIARQLATQELTVVLADIVSDEDLKKTAAGLEEELQRSSSSSPVFYHRVDITSDESVQQLAKWLKETFGHISILVNNAGIAVPAAAVDYKSAQDILDTNYWGTKRVTEALTPLLSSTQGARVIFMTSRLGAYTRLKDGHAKGLLSKGEQLTEDDLDDIGLKYLDDVKADRVEQGGWISLSDFYPAYSESKMLVSAYMLLLAKSIQSNGKRGSVLVSAACPGPTHTAIISDDIANQLSQIGWKVNSVAEGADTPVWLTLLPKDGYPTGKFFAERQEYPYNLHIQEFDRLQTR